MADIEGKAASGITQGERLTPSEGNKVTKGI